MKTAPCITCPDKGCGSRHDTCEKYKEWDGKRKEILKKQNRLSGSGGSKEKSGMKKRTGSEDGTDICVGTMKRKENHNAR